jgi:predicted glycoside hydrolase/deacetylase ChbG (UPF0249 family)
MVRLIFNADDLGLSRGVNTGIVSGYKDGVVNSASLMTTTEYFEETVNLIKSNNLENIGLHFNLTEGKSLISTHKTLIDSNGNFMRNVCRLQDLDLFEVERELEAQLTRAVVAGVLITHLDSHHHIHMSEKLGGVFLELATKYKLPLRKVDNTYLNPLKRFKHNRKYKKHHFYTDFFTSVFYDDDATVQVITETIKKLNGSVEIMCHPGYRDENNGIYNVERERELEVLKSDSIKKLVLQIKK